MKVKILGTEYEIITNAEEKDYPKLSNLLGYTDFSIKQIVVRKLEQDNESLEDLKKCEKSTLRHELIHAFLFESGLDNNSWARNEEIVDWIALQFEKMLATFIDLGAIKIPDESVTITTDLKVNLDEDRLKELLNNNINDLVKIGGDE